MSKRKGLRRAGTWGLNKRPEWKFTCHPRVDLGPDYGLWIHKDDFAQRIGPEGRAFFRELADVFETRLEFIDAHRYAQGQGKGPVH